MTACYAEAGGEFVDGGHQVLHDFLQAYDLAMVPIPSGQRLFRFDGTVLRGESLSDLGAEAARDEARIERETARLAARIAETARPWESAADLDRHSVGAWLDELRLGRIARTFQQIWRTVDYGAAPERLSLLAVCARRAPLAACAGPDLGAGPGRHGSAADGDGGRAGRAGDAWAPGRRRSGRTRTASRSPTSSDGATCSLRARYGVLAIPPPALRRVELDPPFERFRQDTVAGLEMGRITKILVQARRRFWEDHGVSGRAFTDGMLRRCTRRRRASRASGRS